VSNDTQPITNDTSVALLNQKIEMMHGDFIEMKSVLKDLTVAINKLALVEERQAEFRRLLELGTTAMEEFKTRLSEVEKAVPDLVRELLDKLNTRVIALETAAPDSKRTSAWVDRVFGAAVTVVTVMLLREAGVL
jgi:hypothetical protein